MSGRLHADVLSRLSAGSELCATTWGISRKVLRRCVEMCYQIPEGAARSCLFVVASVIVAAEELGFEGSYVRSQKIG